MAQVDTGAISGILTDSSGTIVPGAQITVTQQETNVRMTLPSNDTGLYAAQSLQPGHCEWLWPRLVSKHNTKQVNFSLAIGGTSTEISAHTWEVDAAIDP